MILSAAVNCSVEDRRGLIKRTNVLLSDSAACTLAFHLGKEGLCRGILSTMRRDTLDTLEGYSRHPRGIPSTIA